MTPERIKKIAMAAVVVSLVALFIFFDLGQYFTLDFIKASQAELTDYYAKHPAAVIGAYVGIYIVVTALSLPGAAVLTLAGGGLFGLLTGAVVVSFASTIGATLACFFSRFVLRDWVQTKVGHRLEAVNRGMEKEGAFYLFSLRLVPAFPFWMINLVMGLTTIPLATFYWVSQVGMLPGTLVYVNAGKELAKIDSLGGILSPGLIISFVILGVFPLVIKKVLAYYRTRADINNPGSAPAENSDQE